VPPGGQVQWRGYVEHQWSHLSLSQPGATVRISSADHRRGVPLVPFRAIQPVQSRRRSPQTHQPRDNVKVVFTGEVLRRILYDTRCEAASLMIDRKRY